MHQYAARIPVMNAVAPECGVPTLPDLYATERVAENVILFEKFVWRELRDRVCSGPLRERLQNLYAELSALIHGRKTVSRKDARDAIEETLQVVEQLFEEHQL